MPPPLAAVLCVGFILWLIRRDSKDNGPISPGLWVPLIWVTIIASRPVGYWFASGTIAAAADDSLGGSFIDRNTYLTLIICGMIVLARRQIDWGQLIAQSRMLWIFYAYLLLSTLWSDYTFVSFKRWFKEFGNLVMILIILTEKNPVAAVRAVFIRCAYILIPVSVLFIKYFPELGRYTHRWSYETLYCGVALNKNCLGVAAMVSGLFLLWQMVETRRNWEDGIRLSRFLREVWPELFVFLMCCWLLRLANSATALTCLVFSSIVLLTSGLSWVRSNLRNIGWCGLVIALILLAFTVSPGFRTAVTDVLGRDATLTGRTLIWEECLKLGTDPLIGAGFASTWLTPRGANLAEELGIPHAHNGYLETYLHSGWIGTCLLLMVLFDAGRRATSLLAGNCPVGRLFIAFFLGALVYNYTEITFNTCNIIGFAVWLMAAYYPASAVNNCTVEYALDPVSNDAAPLESLGGFRRFR